jgi:hypothetical protein
MMAIPSPDNPDYEKKLDEIIALIKDNDLIATKWWGRIKESGIKDGIIRQEDFDYIRYKLLQPNGKDC